MENAGSKSRRSLERRGGRGLGSAREVLLGVIYLRDRLRPATPAVIAALRNDGNSVALVSGDRAVGRGDGGARRRNRGSARRSHA